ncbi:MAG: hypothetical protein Q9213_003198 [Squamulea squamosa]
MLRNGLRDLSSKLDTLYSEALLRIDDQSEDDRTLALKALRWVAYTYRPLDACTLQEAMAIEPEAADFYSGAEPAIEDILDVCAGLLVVDGMNRSIRLVHYTAQDYFDGLADSRFLNAHAAIAADCITYLSYRIIQESGNAKRYPLKLLPYASTFWAQHAKAKGGSLLQTRIKEYLTGDPRVYLRTITEYDRSDPWAFSRPLHEPDTCHGIGIAAFLGLDDILINLLQDTKDINALSYYGLTALHLAVRNDQATAIDILLRHDADTERRGRNPPNRTPLLLAIEVEALSAAAALIDRGANVMTLNSEHITPVATVHCESPVRFLELLFNAGAILQAQDILSTKSPLMSSVLRNHDIKTIQWLAEHASYPASKISTPSMALMDATVLESEQFVLTMLKYGADINITSSGGSTALHWACSDEHFAVMRALLHHGIDVDAQDRLGRTALHLAAYQGRKNAAVLLLNHRARINTRDITNATALHAACVGGQPVVSRLLLDSGIAVDAEDTCGHSALHYAARYGCVDNLELLLQYGAGVNKQDSNGWTPLLIAIEYGQTHIAVALLQWGVDVDMYDAEGMTALHKATAKGNVMIVKKILNENPAVGTRTRHTLSTKYSENEQGLREMYSGVEGITDIDCGDAVRAKLIIPETAPTTWHATRIGCLVHVRQRFLEWKVWRKGMTALDIANLRNDVAIIRLLKPLIKEPEEVDPPLIDRYLCDIFRVLSIDEIGGKLS